MKFLIYFLFVFSIYAREHINEDKWICGTAQLQKSPQEISYLNKLAKFRPSPKTYHIGDVEEFYTYNFETEKYSKTSATLRATEQYIQIWVEDTEWDNNVTQQDVDQILDALLYHTPQYSINPDKGIVDIIHSIFGLPPDFDGDGIIDFLITDIKDGWGDSQSGFIAGYFSPNDQFMNSSGVSNSNERDMLYIDSYPGIKIHRDDDFEQVLSTVSHEYQHLIHFGNDRFEKLFVNEGMSELSSFLCGYGLRNPSAYFRNTDIALTEFSNDIDKAIKHYSKVAIWTYYLYEKFGADLISEIAMNEQTGTSGLVSALQNENEPYSLNQIFSFFCRAIAFNNAQFDNFYGFNLESLQSLTIEPGQIIYEYPFSFASQIKPYALYFLSFQNGDTLSTEIEVPDAIDFFQLESVTDSGNVLKENQELLQTNATFGNDVSRIGYVFYNLSPNTRSFEFDAFSSEKYYISDSRYTSNAPDFFIRLDQDIPAMRFRTPYDSTLLKGIRIYNSNLNAGIRIKIFRNLPDQGTKNLQADLFLKNLLSGDWTEIDLEELGIIKNEGEFFNIALEYQGKGALGYSKNPENLDVAFLNNSPLINFQVSGEQLAGFWSVEAILAAPVWRKPAGIFAKNFDLKTSNIVFQPNPSNNRVKIEYVLYKPGNLKIEIYDILGRRVKNIFNGWDEGTKTRYWNGRNDRNEMVSSGTYFLLFQRENELKSRKVILLK